MCILRHFCVENVRNAREGGNVSVRTQIMCGHDHNSLNKTSRQNIILYKTAMKTFTFFNVERFLDI